MSNNQKIVESVQEMMLKVTNNESNVNQAMEPKMKSKVLSPEAIKYDNEIIKIVSKAPANNSTLSNQCKPSSKWVKRTSEKTMWDLLAEHKWKKFS